MAGREREESLQASFQIPKSADYPTHIVKNRFSCQNVKTPKGAS